MRKTIISGVVALGLLAVATTVLGHPASFNQADAAGTGADLRVTRYNLIAVAEAGRAGRPLLVADNGGDDSRPSVLG